MVLIKVKYEPAEAHHTCTDGVLHLDWFAGEIKELEESLAEPLLLNGYFKKVKQTKATSILSQPKESQENINVNLRSD